jgi:hypothetical protein
MATTGSALSTKPDPSVPTEVLQKEASPSIVTMVDFKSDEAHVANESPIKSAAAVTVATAAVAVPVGVAAPVTPAIAAPAVAAASVPVAAEQVDTTTPATATATAAATVSGVQKPATGPPNAAAPLKGVMPMPPPVNKPQSQPQPQSQSQPRDATKEDPKPPIVTTMTGIPTALANLRPSATAKRPVVTNRTPSTAPKAPPGSAKKRKLASAVTPSAVRTLPTAMPPLADPHVVTTVHDLMGLLQLYGPLTLAQLDHNLPPPPPRGGGGAVGWNQHLLSDIVQLLVATGVVQAVQDSQPLQYCMCSGIPRADVVLPSRIMGELEMTRDQTEKSVQRVAILKQALLEGTPAKEVLKTMLRDHPDIVNDPVYLAALRNAHVDTSMIH